LSAICAEVEAINRLANHRQFLAGFLLHRQLNADLVAKGHGNEPAQWLVLELTQNYFATYDALLPKLGLLHPYFNDRITRFYTYAKAVTENYRPNSAWQLNATAAMAVEALDNDITLLQTMHTLGEHIASFRKAAPPGGLIDPLRQIEDGQSPTLTPSEGHTETQSSEIESRS